MKLIGGTRDGNKNWKYSLFGAPVLYQDLTVNADSDGFLNSKQVTVALVYGPKTARARATGGVSAGGSTNMASIHHLTHTTPGMIANAAIQTMWALSKDKELKPVGIQTSIKWRSWQQQLHEYLLTGLRDRRENIIALFADWDAELFPDTDDGLGSAQGSSGGRDELQQALEALSKRAQVEMPEGNDEGENMDADERQSEN
ncbi:hypothetical protein B0H14DRAFT_2674133 [Mycena olivaceomarginata]|nr:hypothetical protein B0H14DRAFT_2940491 [Mycena olivaceomarginata]KAJ7790248.1 hypothetical protein B0H14DRAFT_2940497 [Mycena olivaceomarginata]KAJ7899231.1 hypothetical protein B0H14DRAFT_2674133 [Mycena olivaceomarginata]